MDAVIAILPIALTLIVGWAAVASGVVPRAQWDGIETLSFRVLIPAVLILAIGRAELSLERYGALIGVLWLSLAIVGAAVITIGRRRADWPVWTTLFQTSLRWNGFIALAAASLIGGAPLFDMIAVIMAALIPVINISCIFVMAAGGDGRAAPRAIVGTILRNPLIQASGIGLALNLSGVVLPGTVENALDLIGRAALGVGVLAVGAALEPRRLWTRAPRVWIGVAVRPVLMPALFLGLARLVGLPVEAQLAGVLTFAMPAAANGYVIARKMGGDAPLYADVMALQTLAALVMIPIWVQLAERI